jgi:hypothetical protein
MGGEAPHRHKRRRRRRRRRRWRSSTVPAALPTALRPPLAARRCGTGACPESAQGRRSAPHTRRAVSALSVPARPSAQERSDCYSATNASLLPPCAAQHPQDVRVVRQAVGGALAMPRAAQPGACVLFACYTGGGGFRPSPGGGATQAFCRLLILSAHLHICASSSSPGAVHVPQAGAHAQPMRL